jgi:hypothetical protein
MTKLHIMKVYIQSVNVKLHAFLISALDVRGQLLHLSFLQHLLEIKQSSYILDVVTKGKILPLPGIEP